MDVKDDDREHNAPAQPASSLLRLRRFEGGPTAFWPVFLEAMAEVSRAPLGAIVIDGKDGWKAIAVHPRSAKLWEMLQHAGFQLEAAARQAIASFLEGEAGQSYGGVATGVEYVSEEIRDGQIIVHERRPYLDWVHSVDFSEMLAQNLITSNSFLYRRSVFNEVGGRCV